MLQLHDGGLQRRFWAKVNRLGPDDCWPWEAATIRGGYGKLAVLDDGGIKRFVGAHRLAWLLSGGVIEPGDYVCHRCDNPPCCNPAHLFSGPPMVNVSDMDAKGRRGRFGQPGISNPNARVAELAVMDIRRRRAAGEIARTIAESHGIGTSHVYRIAAGEARKDGHAPHA